AEAKKAFPPGEQLLVIQKAQGPEPDPDLGLAVPGARADADRSAQAALLGRDAQPSETALGKLQPLADEFLDVQGEPEETLEDGQKTVGVPCLADEVASVMEL